MEKVLKVTNFLLGVIAICLLLVVAKISGADMPKVAQAQNTLSQSRPQPVYLVYWPDGNNNSYQPVVGTSGVVRTTK